jgi:predicted ABC-type transport system involved in lysophospholipase L1 biosynthesis ATPase subunit
LTSHIHRFPNQLSIGECQRAAVVRALINSPKLLLADEPTGSLDEANTLQLADLLLDLNREENVALVLVTHSLELAARMDTCYQLHSGKLILQ